MENLDAQYKRRAQEIENDIIKLCNLRQMATSISKEEFQEQYSVDIKQREHIEHKYNLDVRTKIYEFLMNHPKWKNRLDSIKFMDVFDECIKKYQPQGSYFLSLFINQYSLRMQDVKKGTYVEKYIDEKDSVFNHAESINIDTNNDEEATNKISPLDKKSQQDYYNDTIAKDNGIIFELYKTTINKLNKKDIPYLRCYFTVTALSNGLLFEDLGGDYLDQDLYIEQQGLTSNYLKEYEQKKAASGKNIQKRAFLKDKYTSAIVKKYGLQPDTIRKKFKIIQKLLTEIGTLS